MVESRFNIPCVRSLVIVALMLNGASAHALSVLYLSPAQAQVGTGDVIALDIFMTFAGYGILGGGFDISWDATSLQLQQVDSPVIGDPQFFNPPDLNAGLASNWSIGDFSLFTGNQQLGTLWFEVLPGMGGSTSVVTATTTGDSGVFVDYFGEREFMIYESATLSRVPLPASLWLFVSGMALLAGASRAQGRRIDAS